MTITRKINWLLEANVFDDGNPERLAKILHGQGMTSAMVAFESVDGDSEELKPTTPLPFHDQEDVFVYGSMNLMKWLLHIGRWPRLAWYEFPRLRCQTYYAHWGRFLLQRNYAFLPLAEISRRKNWVFQTLSQNNAVFIRPDDNAKSFGGGIVQEDGFDKWYKLANFYDPGPDCLAVISTPEKIHAEWRLIIAQRQVVTASQYRVNGLDAVSPDCPPEVIAFARTVAQANDFNPHPMYVMDVARTDDDYRLIEIGSMCCASLYACDLAKVVHALVEIHQSL